MTAPDRIAHTLIKATVSRENGSLTLNLYSVNVEEVEKTHGELALQAEWSN
jgi:hypothetical protein